MWTDEEVVARVQAGERELFEIIFDRHYARIERSVRSLGLPEPDREDVVSETFLRAFAGIGSFQVAAGKRYLPYLYAIARNLCTDRLRQRQRSCQALCLEDVEVAEIPDESEHAAPLATLLKREQHDRIRAALSMLSPLDREIIALSYDRDLSSKEIMAIMQKPSVTAVTTHLHKAMKKLRALVGSEGAEGDPRHGVSDARARAPRLEYHGRPVPRREVCKA
jgi:RNA polymerase sigma-70 factor (ECF subfamily)